MKAKQRRQNEPEPQIAGWAESNTLPTKNHRDNLFGLQFLFAFAIKLYAVGAIKKVFRNELLLIWREMLSINSKTSLTIALKILSHSLDEREKWRARGARANSMAKHSSPLHSTSPLSR